MPPHTLWKIIFEKYLLLPTHILAQTIEMPFQQLTNTSILNTRFCLINFHFRILNGDGAEM